MTIEPPVTRHRDAPAVGATLAGHGPACLVCGQGHPSGLRLRFVAGPGASVATCLDLHDRAATTWTAGRCVDVLLDVVLHEALELVHLVLLRPGRTESVRVERAGPGRPASVLTVAARPEVRRGQILVLVAEARDHRDDVVARARSRFVLDDVSTVDAEVLEVLGEAARRPPP